jgi:hypothetical protein
VLAGDKEAKAESNTMDVGEAKLEVPTAATLAPGSTVQPKRIFDLESMAFSQGGHLMSSQKCKLLEGSFKHSKKGYEGIHVLAPKSKPIPTAGSLLFLFGRARHSPSLALILCGANSSLWLLVPMSLSFFVHPLVLERYVKGPDDVQLSSF